MREKSRILDCLTDGKVLSTVGVLILVTCLSGNMTTAILFALAWIVAVSPSMGEEHGAIGDYKGALPAYLDRSMTDRGRAYDIKKGIRRGVFIGAAFALVTGCAGFIAASLLFVPAVWIGQTVNRLVTRQPGWTLAEPLIGAIVVGMPMAAYFA